MQYCTRRVRRRNFSRLVIVFIVVLLVISSCSQTPKLRSASSFYDGQGNRLNKGRDSFEQTMNYRNNFDIVFDSVRDAIFRKGFKIEFENRDKGIIQGSGRIVYNAGMGNSPFTISVTIKQINEEPLTEMKMLLDQHWGIFYGSLAQGSPANQYLGPELLADIQKIISTYR